METAIYAFLVSCWLYRQAALVAMKTDVVLGQLITIVATGFMLRAFWLVYSLLKPLS